MKTAMQELIEFLNELNSDKTKPPVLERKLLQKWCETKLLQKEKEQIIASYTAGEIRPYDGKKYYNSTFGCNVE